MSSHNLAYRVVHPMCCTDCLGSGQRVDGLGKCNHAFRVDVTGEDDDPFALMRLAIERALKTGAKR